MTAEVIQNGRVAKLLKVDDKHRFLYRGIDHIAKGNAKRRGFDLYIKPDSGRDEMTFVRRIPAGSSISEDNGNIIAGK